MYRNCNGVTRRNLLKAGLCGGLGIGLADLLRMEADGKVAAESKGKSAIFLYLDGGQAHQDSWDLKPGSGKTAGEFKPIKTNIPGLEVCEHMPRLARQADKYAVLRGVYNAIGVHGLGMSLVRSGNRPRAALTYPDAGSVIAKEFRAPQGVPPFVSLPIRVSNGTLETPGYLGVAYRSFAVTGDPSAERFVVKALANPGGMPERRVARRRSLVGRLDTAFKDVDLANQHLDGMDKFYGQAFDILRSECTRAAFDLAKEKPQVRDRYGRTSVGQACLLARRLIEAGVRCVTIDFGGWDTHRDNFTNLKTKLLPPWDAALAALLADLHDRGLLKITLVWSTGEMGRTPKINGNSGRDHWGKAMSMVMAGAGIKGGLVHGKTDQTAADVVEKTGKPEDVAATALHSLGIDPKKEYHTATGRPIQIVRNGDVVKELLG
jgi:Protein of unknown function (DUF1501)